MPSLESKLRKSRKTFDRQRVVLMGKLHRAGADFVTSAGDATRAFGQYAGDESLQWWGYLQDWAAAAPGKVKLRPAGWGQLERELWLQLARLLDSVQGKVHGRIRQLAAPTRFSRGAQLPMKDYETLTARAIVAQVSKLTAAECRQVHEFEGQHKQRATVLRALEQRIAA